MTTAGAARRAGTVRLAAALLALLAGVVPALVAGGLAGTARASTSKCVGLVVDFSAFGGSAEQACVTVPADGTGADVLEGGGHKVSYDPRYPRDFVCAIDGLPKGGCGATDDTHFWAYYHRAPGGTSWQMSSEGLGTYDPKPGSTEGWVYDDGATSPPVPAAPRAGLCPAASPSPSPVRSSPAQGSPTHSPAATSSPVVDATHRTRATAGSTPTGQDASSTHGSRVSGARPGGRRAGHRAGRAQPGTPSRSATPPPASGTTAAAPTPSPVAVADPPRHSGSGLPVGLVAGVAAAALLAAAAWWRVRASGR